jgi:uncharacterized membrane protein
MDFKLDKADEKRIVDAIKAAEKNTSGEIRVHIEENSDKQPLDRALEVFEKHGMHNTELRNGVLFYVCKKSHRFAVLGDEGIDTKVPDDFWESTKNKVIENFVKGQFAQGLALGIDEAGIQLAKFFPYQDGDQNELSDEISRS